MPNRACDVVDAGTFQLECSSRTVALHDLSNSEQPPLLVLISHALKHLGYIFLPFINFDGNFTGNRAHETHVVSEVVLSKIQSNKFEVFRFLIEHMINKVFQVDLVVGLVLGFS